MAFIDTASSNKKEETLYHCDYVVQAFRDTLSENNKRAKYKIDTINILGIDGEGSVSDLIHAIEDAEKKGAQICNLSLSTYEDCPKLKAVIETSKMLFVAAAGNEGENLDEGFPSYPTNYKLENVISVAALDDSGNLMEMSNYGDDTVDVVANGILKYRNEVVEGTSIATARITAVATILYSISDDRFSARECKKKIVSLSFGGEKSL